MGIKLNLACTPFGAVEGSKKCDHKNIKENIFNIHKTETTEKAGQPHAKGLSIGAGKIIFRKPCKFHTRKVVRRLTDDPLLDCPLNVRLAHLQSNQMQHNTAHTHKAHEK